MNLKTIGLVMGIIGVILLLIVAIIGIVIGINSKNRTEIYNKDDSSDTEKKDAEGAEETNAFLLEMNMGLASFGVGLTMIGVGFAIAKDAKGNMAVLGVGLVAALILFLSFAVAIYSGIISKEKAEIWNKDDTSEKDDKRIEDIQENEAFLGPVNSFCGGFLFGSFGIVLALFTIVLGAFLSRKEKAQHIETITDKIRKQEQLISEIVNVQDVIIQLKNKGIDTREMEHLVNEAKGALR